MVDAGQWLSRLSALPGSIGLRRVNIPSLQGAIPDPPLGARQVSHGYADDLWQARPTLDRPYPVILIHGTISSKNVWQNLVLRLREDGFVVFAPDYGVHGTQDIPTSALDVGAYIEQVITATGARQVDIVGHSQGGLLARYWMNEMGGDAHVHHLISLGAPHHGTTIGGMLGPLLTSDMTQRVAAATIRRVFGPAGMQQVVGSPLFETLSTSHDLRPYVRYTCFATRNDATVYPHDHAFLSDADPPAGAVVSNHILQEFSPDIGRVRHEELPSHPEVQRLVHRALIDALIDDDIISAEDVRDEVDDTEL